MEKYERAIEYYAQTKTKMVLYTKNPHNNIIASKIIKYAKQYICILISNKDFLSPRLCEELNKRAENGLNVSIIFTNDTFTSRYKLSPDVNVVHTCVKYAFKDNLFDFIISDDSMYQYRYNQSLDKRKSNLNDVHSVNGLLEVYTKIKEELQ